MDAQLRRLSSSALLLLRLAFWLALAVADTRTDARRYFNRGMEAIQEGRTREGIDLLIQRQFPDAHEALMAEADRRVEALYAAS